MHFTKRHSLGLLLATAGVSILIIVVLPRDAFWITDCANKYLTSVNVANKHFTDFSIDYPGIEYDSKLEANPIPDPFSVVRGGKIYSFYPPLFSYLSAFLYSFLGFRGLFVLPLIGALAGMWLVILTSRAFSLSEWQSAACGLAAYWCTPCLFYAFCFWEHTVGTACVLLAVLILLRQLSSGNQHSLLIAGCALGVGIGFREELYAMCGAIFVSLLLDKSSRKILVLYFPLGVLAGVGPVWLFQRWAIGNAWGFHLVGNLRSSRLWDFASLTDAVPERFEVTLQLLGNVSTNRTFNLSYIIFFLSFSALALFYRKKRARAFAVLCLGAMVLAASSGAYLAFSDDEVRAWMNGNGLLMHGATLIPLLGAFIYEGNEFSARAARLLRNTTVLFIIFICLSCPPITAQGIHWGPRIMLPVFPMLLPLLFLSFSRASENRSAAKQRRPSLRWALLALLLTCAAVQIYSIFVLNRKLETTASIVSRVRGLPDEVIISGLWWFPQEMAPIFYEKMFFFAPDYAHLQKLAASLKEKGRSAFIYVTPVDERQRLLFRTQSKLKFFDVSVSRYEIQ